MIDAATRPNDQFGYSVYVLALLANAEIAEKVAKARDFIGARRTMIDAHVTVRGTFHSIEDLENLKKLLRSEAARHKPCHVRFSESTWDFIDRGNDFHLSIMRCEKSPELLSLHEALDDIVRPQSVNAYPSEYRAHLTLCEDITAEQLQRAREVAAATDIGTGFDADQVHLLGRVGPAYGGNWNLIESFKLSD